jgi:hypothetical protein
MRRSLLSVFLVGAGLLMASAGVFAHHSVSGEFDGGKPIEFTGTVKMVQWLNPHIYTQVETKDASGKAQLWRVEGGAPNSLFRQGWRKDSLKPGLVVTFKGIRGKNPESVNVNGQLSSRDGTKLWTGKGPASRD